jgi:uncharacterized protein (TIGR00369 family)
VDFELYDEAVAEGMARSHDGAGGLPAFLGIRVVEWWAGGMRAEIDVRADLLNPFKNLHGGVLAAFVDHMLGTVCYPVIPRGSWAATTEFKLNYLAPASAGTLSAVSQVVSLTKRTAVARIDVTNNDRLVCAAQGTVLVMAPKS